MELTIKERLLIGHLLPKEGKLIEMMLAKEILMRTTFTANEISEFGIKDVDNGSVVWDIAKAKDKTIDFSDVELDILKKAVGKLDADGKVTLDLLPLCNKVLEK